MKLVDVVTILALLLSPLIALQVSEMIQRRREGRQRRLGVFRTLMTTRATGVAHDHVQALNMIDIEFQGEDAKSKAVLNAWKAYLDHLNSPQTNEAVWVSKKDDLFVDLLYEMSRHLDYDFDKTYIRRTSYFPKGVADQVTDDGVIRRGLAGVMRGDGAFPIRIVEPHDSAGAPSRGTPIPPPEPAGQ